MRVCWTIRRNSPPRFPIRIKDSNVSSYVGNSRHRIRSTSLIVLLMALCSGARSSLLGQSPNEAKFSLSGSVVNSVTGEPIRRALVQLQASPPRSCFSDGDGRFEIDGLPAGNFSVSAQKPGFYTNSDEPKALSNVRVTIGASSDAVVLKLSPYGVIYGRITNVEGEALEHIPVRLTAAVVRNGHKRWEQAGFRDSDENGNFRFPNLQPGTFYLAAGPSTEENGALLFAEGQNKAAGKAAMGYPSVYYPNAPDLSSRRPWSWGRGSSCRLSSPSLVYRFTRLPAPLLETPLTRE